MDIRAVLEEIKYKPGFLRRLSLLSADAESSDFDDEESRSIPSDAVPVSVVRYEPSHDALFIRNEEPFAMSGEEEVELYVPLGTSLARLRGMLAQTEFSREYLQILALRVERAKILKRRLQGRFESRFPVRFAVRRISEDGKAYSRMEEGRVVDLSLGGMQVVTEAELAVGSEIDFEIRIYTGILHITGQVVQQGETLAGKSYGVKFTRADGISDRLLRQFLYTQERRQRNAQREEVADGAGMLPARLDRNRARRRWGR